MTARPLVEFVEAVEVVVIVETLLAVAIVTLTVSTG